MSLTSKEYQQLRGNEKQIRLQDRPGKPRRMYDYVMERIEQMSKPHWRATHNVILREIADRYFAKDGCAQVPESYIAKRCNVKSNCVSTTIIQLEADKAIFVQRAPKGSKIVNKYLINLPLLTDRQLKDTAEKQDNFAEYAWVDSEDGFEGGYDDHSRLDRTPTLGVGEQPVSIFTESGSTTTLGVGETHSEGVHTLRPWSLVLRSNQDTLLPKPVTAEPVPDNGFGVLVLEETLSPYCSNNDQGNDNDKSRHASQSYRSVRPEDIDMGQETPPAAASLSAAKQLAAYCTEELYPTWHDSTFSDHFLELLEQGVEASLIRKVLLWSKAESDHWHTKLNGSASVLKSWTTMSGQFKRYREQTAINQAEAASKPKPKYVHNPNVPRMKPKAVAAPFIDEDDDPVSPPEDDRETDDDDYGSFDVNEDELD